MAGSRPMFWPPFESKLPASAIMMVNACEMPDVLMENSTFWPRVKHACGLASGSSQNSAARWMVHGVTCSTRMSQLVR